MKKHPQLQQLPRGLSQQKIDRHVIDPPNIRGIQMEIVDERKERLMEMDDLLLKVETSKTTGAQPFAEIEKAILTAFRSQLNIRVNVQQAEEGSLPRYEFKARRFKRIVE